MQEINLRAGLPIWRGSILVIPHDEEEARASLAEDPGARRARPDGGAAAWIIAPT